MRDQSVCQSACKTNAALQSYKAEACLAPKLRRAGQVALFLFQHRGARVGLMISSFGTSVHSCIVSLLPPPTAQQCQNGTLLLIRKFLKLSQASGNNAERVRRATQSNSIGILRCLQSNT